MDCRRRATPGYIWGALPCANAMRPHMSPASRGARRRRWSVHREKLGGCLRSARAGRRSPR
eukprot:5690630-Prymnesium_polylepis.1